MAKIALTSGPRQVGKSTLAKSLLLSPQNYFLYDDERFRRAWARSPEESIAGRGEGPIVLDEIYKNRRWKTRIKGIYDRFGGDSLLGRDLPYRLHPFSTAETENPISPPIFSRDRGRCIPGKIFCDSAGFRNSCFAATKAKLPAGAACAWTG